MQSAICTLFEGDYHKGLAALVNSLFDKGFEGTIYAGYRGAPPQWASSAEDAADFGYSGTTVLSISDKVQLYFIPLKTNYHFTNFKPNFMLDLWKGPAKMAQSFFYIDPDVVINEPWHTFTDWVEHGIALCEDVNSPLSPTHPRRAAWKRFYLQHSVDLQFADGSYVNGGFVGLTRERISFLDTWKKLQELMASQIGGLERSSLQGKQVKLKQGGAFAPFSKTDQDALNATIGATAETVSIAGKEAMGFIGGWPYLPHALGHPKPWNKNFISMALKGYSPKTVDKLYWNHVRSPIGLESSQKISSKQSALRMASFIGRFYTRQ